MIWINGCLDPLFRPRQFSGCGRSRGGPLRARPCHRNEEEIRAVAEHEHLPQIVALELEYLMRGPDGELLVSHMFIDGTRAAERCGDLDHAAQLKKALRHLLEGHLARSPVAPDR